MDTIKCGLALGAHPEDLELGCGATLAKMAARGVQIRAVILSKGMVGGATDCEIFSTLRTLTAPLSIRREMTA